MTCARVGPAPSGRERPAIRGLIMRGLLKGFVAVLSAAACVVSIAQAPKVGAPPVSRGEAQAGPEAASGASITALQGGRVLVTGGDQLLSRALLIGLDGTISAAAPMLVPRVQHATVALADGRVLVTGGMTAEGATNSAEVFDPSRNEWSDAGTMAEARAGHTMSLLSDGRVVIVGG